MPEHKTKFEIGDIVYFVDVDDMRKRIVRSVTTTHRADGVEEDYYCEPLIGSSNGSRRSASGLMTKEEAVRKFDSIKSRQFLGLFG